MNLLEQVRKVTTVITHENSEGRCPDAVASLILLRDALPQPFEVRWVNYGTPAHASIQPRPGLLFVDMTPHVTRDPSGALTSASASYLARLAAEGTVVLDHHKSAEDVVAAFGPLGVFADEVLHPGVSGATLALEEVWTPLYRASSEYGMRSLAGGRAEQLAELAAIRDTWQRTDHRWREACGQACALTFWPVDQLDLTPELDEKLRIGPALLEREEERARGDLAHACTFSHWNAHVLLFEGGSHDATNVADIAPRHIDLVVAWRYEMVGDRPMLRVSCRSRGAVPCGVLAKLHGGGGHGGSAGFSVPVVPGELNPYERLRQLVTSDIERLGLVPRSSE